MTEGQAGQDHLGIDHHRGREMDKLDGLVNLDSDKIGQGHQVKISPRKQPFLMTSQSSWTRNLDLDIKLTKLDIKAIKETLEKISANQIHYINP